MRWLNKPQGCAVSANKIFAVGGKKYMMEYQDTIEIYDPVQGSWQTHHSLMLTGRGANQRTNANTTRRFPFPFYSECDNSRLPRQAKDSHNVKRSH
jgi:hypothetical protein